MRNKKTYALANAYNTRGTWNKRLLWLYTILYYLLPIIAFISINTDGISFSSSPIDVLGIESILLPYVLLLMPLYVLAVTIMHFPKSNRKAIKDFFIPNLINIVIIFLFQGSESVMFALSIHGLMLFSVMIYISGMVYAPKIAKEHKKSYTFSSTKRGEYSLCIKIILLTMITTMGVFSFGQIVQGLVALIDPSLPWWSQLVSAYYIVSITAMAMFHYSFMTKFVPSSKKRHQRRLSGAWGGAWILITIWLI